jgi:hypothetical protein
MTCQNRRAHLRICAHSQYIEWTIQYYGAYFHLVTFSTRTTCAGDWEATTYASRTSKPSGIGTFRLLTGCRSRPSSRLDKFCPLIAPRTRRLVAFSNPPSRKRFASSHAARSGMSTMPPRSPPRRSRAPISSTLSAVGTLHSQRTGRTRSPRRQPTSPGDTRGCTSSQKA